MRYPTEIKLKINCFACFKKQKTTVIWKGFALLPEFLDNSWVF